MKRVASGRTGTGVARAQLRLLVPVDAAGQSGAGPTWADLGTDGWAGTRRGHPGGQFPRDLGPGHARGMPDLGPWGGSRYPVRVVRVYPGVSLQGLRAEDPTPATIFI